MTPVIDEEKARSGGTAEGVEPRRNTDAPPHASSPTSSGARWTRLGTVPSATSATPRSSEGTVRGLLAALAAAAAVFGPIAFATLHSVYAQFYGSFGISPEDVGINSGRVLTTSLVAFGFAFCIWVSTWLITFAIATAALTLIVPTDDDGAPSSGKPLVYRALGGAFLIYVGITFAIDISATKGLEGSSVRAVLNWEKTVAWLIPAIALLSVIVAAAPGSFATDVRRTAKGINIRFIWVATMILAAIVAANLIVRNAANLGKHQADLVKSGHAVLSAQLPQPVGTTRLRALDIRVVIARVTWLQAPPDSLRTTGCLMYLGSSDGVAFLWDVRGKHLLRLPDSAAVVSTSSTAKQC